MTDLLSTGFKGAARRLTDIDIPRIGHRIGVGEDEIHAVMDVEARKGGFDHRGRPAMLFEPHIFWKELGPGPKRDAAVRAGLARPKWVREYPSDSYPRLMQAIAIDLDAAVRSASWGLGQVMGFNAHLAGYESAEAMVVEFLESEALQLEAMVTFIDKAGLARHLRRHDWGAFAEGYNGPAYAVHGYHTRLKDRFEWWSKVPDTPWTPACVGSHCPLEPAV